MSTESTVLLDDPARLAALEDGGLLHGSPDPAFDQLTSLAMRVLEVPVALVSVVGPDEQRFLGCAAVSEAWQDLHSTPLSHSFCRHAVEAAAPLVIEDARTHPDFEDHPAIEEMGVVAYAGIPLVTSQGQVLGTVCAIDHEPRSWTDEELGLLREVAGLALARVELRTEARRRRRSEQELFERSARYRALVENMDELISVIDPAGTIRYESSSVERILGYRPEDLVGTEVLGWVHSDDRETVESTLAQLLERPGATRRGEVRFRHADDGYRWLEYIAQNLIHIPAVEGIVVNSRDVTQRRALEQSAREAEKLDALGRLAGGVAHDFNNILGVIGANAELAAGELAEDHPVRADLEEIVSSVQRGARLTKQLLGFSRTKSVEPEVLDPSDILQEMEELLRRLMTGDAELRLDVNQNVPRIRVSRGEMEQVILNLVVNARDALEDRGSVTVSIDGPEPIPEGTVPVDEEGRGEYVALRVSDTGMGIPEDRRDRIFEPFYTTKPEGKGTGLGLSTVYGVVVRSGGRIGLESVVGEGTTFSVFFPVVPSPSGGDSGG